MEASSRDGERSTYPVNALPSPLLTPVTEEFSSGYDGSFTSKTPVEGNGVARSDDLHFATDLRIRDHDSDEQLPPRRLTMASSSGSPLKLSPAQITDLKFAPASLPVRAVSPLPDNIPPLDFPRAPNLRQLTSLHLEENHDGKNLNESIAQLSGSRQLLGSDDSATSKTSQAEVIGEVGTTVGLRLRPSRMSRSISTPMPVEKKHSVAERSKLHRTSSKAPPQPDSEALKRSHKPSTQNLPSLVTTASLPLPPLSLATHLHLELSTDRPSPLYIHRLATSDIPYESAKVKFERLLNFLLLPPQLEQVLLFGALTCLDAWLYTFTILPLRFIMAILVFFEWVLASVMTEISDLVIFTYLGLMRLWRRHARNVDSSSPINNLAGRQGELHTPMTGSPVKPTSAKSRIQARISHGRQKSRSTPSMLQANHKADIMQGLLIIICSVILLRFDASRMYHAIRGQAAIKLYVIYNVLEVCDRLFSALGQDIIDCLFSPEMLERKPNGRSRVMRPLWMFLLALIYTVCHATAFFYQVITLNVAVNSYSNALLTLLMSNQFVEIKGTVFKKIEKENLFQLTCADIVERFQLWLMLVIIALRNIVELGGLSVGSGDFTGPSSSGSPVANASTGAPLRTFGILPNAFQIFPSLFPWQVLGPFFLVIGSEMFVDWLKHAYITKFNATSHAVYGRFLDVLAKDYYNNAFAEQNLTRRLGLPVIPLACLFIRAILQTYHMFLATNVPSPVSAATSLSLSAANATASPVIAQIDHIFRNALGRSSLGGSSAHGSSFGNLWSWTLDDVIALTTMLIFFLALYLLLLAVKLVLGMILLAYARERYKGMKAREKQSFVQTETKRIGGWGAVELGDERRKVIYEGDPVGLGKMREREVKGKEGEATAVGKEKRGDRLDTIDRYSMVAKRIW